MKRILLSAVAMSFSCMVHAQEIAGKIDNYKGQLIKINIGGCDQDTLKIATDGHFTFHPIIREKNQKFTINLPDGSRVPILVGKNQKVNVHLYPDSKNQVRANFSGDLVELNTYLFTHANELSGPMRAKRNGYTTFKEYAGDIDGLDHELTGLLNKVRGYQELVKEYGIEQKVDILSSKIGYARKEKANSALDPDYAVFMRSVNLNDGQLFNDDPRKGSLGYMGQVERIISWETSLQKPVNFEPGKSFIYKLETLNKLVQNQAIRNSVSGYYVLMYFMGGGNKYANEFAQAFYKVSTDKKQIDFVKERILSGGGNMLSAGSTAPDFEMLDKNGNTVRLSDLRGKFVYVDVWATWCGPCVEEIPYMKTAYEQYKADSRIVFVSVSIDDNTNKWKEKLTKDKPEWPQYIVNGAMQSKLCKEYLISGIPRFMLFDREGKIVNVNEKRPSDKDFVTYLQQQLDKPKEIVLPGGMKLKALGSKRDPKPINN
uniref:TlpA family protein disulfide reductase n=1 Tax=Pedobacter schmidteae TaxID=2201271 RepID=UPI000EAC0C19|nr:TlpA disulfide reductase family protein [Pedobacter schmidteae]